MRRLAFSVFAAVSIFGFGWGAGSLRTTTQYKQFTNSTIHGKVGIKIGLYGVNITLKGNGFAVVLYSLPRVL